MREPVITHWFEPRYGIVDLARNLHRLDAELLGSYIAHHDTGLHVLSAPFDPEDGRAVGAAEVERIVGTLRAAYDWIVLDTSSSLDPAALAGMHAADEIFLVTQLDVSSLRNIQRIRRVLKRIGPDRAPSIVVNRFHSGVEITLKDVERALGLPIFGTLSNDYGSVARAINTGEPVVMRAPGRATSIPLERCEPDNRLAASADGKTLAYQIRPRRASTPRPRTVGPGPRRRA